MNQKFQNIRSVKGRLEFKGDKSISHRALIFSSMAKGKSFIKNLSGGEDVQSTLNCFSQMGVQSVRKIGGIEIIGKGFKGLSKPYNDMNCGNSGTTARLLTGLLCCQKFSSKITGDESLSKRPMDRIINPLKKMGAKIESNNAKFLPIKISPSEEIKAIEQKIEVPSAQVKSGIILCGINLKSQSKLIETIPTRDHTERMLGLRSEYKNGQKEIYFSVDEYPESEEYFIPGDISSAYYFIALTLLTKDSELVIQNISLNESRLTFLNVLTKMGAEFNIETKGESSKEPFGDLIIKSSDLKNVKIDKKIIPNIIDEIPLLAVLSLFAEGDFEIRNCAELRLKESDRIKSTVSNMRSVGVECQEYDDGFGIYSGSQNKYSSFKSFNDHRIAMAFSVLSLMMIEGAEVEDFECVKISNPDFLKQLGKVIVS